MSSPPNNDNKDKDIVAISISSDVSYPPNSKLFCNLCSCNLILLDAAREEWYCNHCCVSYFPNKGEKVKRPNKFETPGPLTDVHGNIIGEKKPIVAMVDDNTKGPSSVYNPPKLPPSFENLIKRTGVKLLDYTTSED